MPLQYSGSYDLVYGHAKQAKAKNWQKKLGNKASCTKSTQKRNAFDSGRTQSKRQI